MTRVAAIDLGSESGRIAAVDFDGSRLNLTVAHRFVTVTKNDDGLRWDTAALVGEVVDGMGALGAEGVTISSVGVDSWGVDYVMLDRSGALLDDPYSYRDPRTNRTLTAALDKYGANALYATTGTQILPINTVFGLLSDVQGDPARISSASRLLPIADYLHYVLSGTVVAERTLASTTGLYNPVCANWSDELINLLGLPRELFPELIDAGTELGTVQELGIDGLERVRVIAPAAHDTASAVLAAPFEHEKVARSGFISSGSWSLIGREQPTPEVTTAAREAQLTNEVGFGGRALVMRNVAGLWLLQACRRQWASEGNELDYQDIASLAAQELPLVSLIAPDSAEFVGQGNMPERIRAFCRRTGQPVPETIGQIARTIVDSLALRYRQTLDTIVEVTGAPIEALHVVGGGSNHSLLRQATADATRLSVCSGPAEATALGNAGAQLIALGELSSISDLRAAVAASNTITTTEPSRLDLWDQGGGRFVMLVDQHSNNTGTAS